MSKQVELAIIGSGIAGVSAAVYAKRAGLDFSIFEPGIVGGQILFMEEVENYVGTDIGIRGSIFAQNIAANLKTLDISPVKERITSIKTEGENIILNSDKASYSAKAIIAATGAVFKKLGIEGEDRLTGKGISYCAICDGFFFKNKEVAVVGGGNSALEEALYLANICSKVYIIHRRDKFRALEYLQQRVSGKDNIEVVFNSVVKEVKGEDVLEQLVIENKEDKKISSLSVNGLFIAIGVKPNTEIFEGLIDTEAGFIITDEAMQTSNKAIWAAGDCRKRPLRQLITAASEGAIAAVSAYKYLKGTYISA